MHLRKTFFVYFLLSVATLAGFAQAQQFDKLSPPFEIRYGSPLLGVDPNLVTWPRLPDIGGMPPIAPHERADLSADAAAVVAGNNRFAVDIFRHLSSEAEPGDNVLVSPFSISSALAMTYAGARGQTAQQMAAVLGFSLPDERLHSAFGEVMRDLGVDREGYQLSIANRLFGQAGYPFKQPFLDVTGRDYGAPLENANFAGDPESSRRRINDWVEDQTNDKIRDLMPDGSVTSQMRLVLTNAIYFNGSWKYKFDPDRTRDETFHGIDGQQTQVPTMFQQQSFSYAERSGFQMLEMPYAGDDLSLVVMLPNERDGLAALEASLTTETLDESLDSLRSHRVNVHLPKFTFDSSFKLGAALRGLGMSDAFDADLADFGGMVDPAIDQLHIGVALHKAFIDVNEEGTEAAAATAIGMVTTTCFCPPPEPKTFRADHPFLFALRDRHSGSLLFMGRVMDPGTLTVGALVPEPGTVMLLVIGLVALNLPQRSFRQARFLS